jgi:predicted transposase YdaD
VLAALAHAGDPQRGPAIARAAVEALAPLPGERGALYWEALLDIATGETRRQLEKAMIFTRDTIKSDFFREYFIRGEEHGIAKGRAEGKAEGKAETLLRIFASRGVVLTAEQQRGVTECVDIATLDRWIDRALAGDSPDALFTDGGTTQR